MNKLGIIAGLLILAFQATTVQAEGSVARGKEKAAPCAACHGADGNGIDPTFPRIAGQYESYLAHALREYKEGRRQNAVMAPMAAPLSEQDIEDLAAYFASLPGELYVLGHRPE